MGRIPLIWEYVAHEIMTISSVSVEDWVNLTANYWTILTGLEDEESALKARGFPQDYIDQVFANKTKKTDRIGRLLFKKPITRFNFENLDYVLFLYNHYKRGLLPHSGSISEQSAYILELFAILQDLDFLYHKQNAQQTPRRT